MVWLWSLTTSWNRKSFDAKHTPRTKQPHTHTSTCVRTSQNTEERWSIWNASRLPHPLMSESVCVCVSFKGPTVDDSSSGSLTR